MTRIIGFEKDEPIQIKIQWNNDAINVLRTR